MKYTTQKRAIFSVIDQVVQNQLTSVL